MNINVLVITNHEYRVFEGGVENYNRILYSNFKDINFIEFSMLNSDNINKLLNYDNVITYKNINLSKKKIYKKLVTIIKKNNISKIIFSGDYYFYPKFLKKYKSKIFFIQHTHPLHYLPFFQFSDKEKKYVNIFSKYKNIIIKLLQYFYITIKNKIKAVNNFFKYCNNIITFTKDDSNIVNRYYKNKNLLSIPLPSVFCYDNFRNIRNKPIKKYDFIIIGRTEKINFDILNKLLLHFNDKKFLFIGNIENKKNKIIKYKNIVIKKPMNKDKLLLKYNESKYLLLPTYSEGFSFVAVESLSLGIPLILWNNYPSAKYLVGNDERGIIINYNDDEIFKINNLLNNKYNELSKKCTSFYNENLTLNNFVNSWKKILY